MKNSKILRFVSVVLSALMILSVSTVVPAFAAEKNSANTAKKMSPPTDSGTTGDCEWAFYEEENLLVISGEGNTADYVAGGPWNAYVDKITAIDIREGVIAIGMNCFYGLSYVKDVSIADSVCLIEDYAFYGNTSLSYVELPDELTSLGEAAFNRTGLERVDINDKLGPIGSGAFAETKMQTVYIPENVDYIGDKAFGYIVGEYGYEANPGFVIYGEPGSVAEGYANDNMFRFKNPYSGDSGAYVKWNYDPETETLTFSGNGDMANYSSEVIKPWDSSLNPRIGYITKVVFEEGVTSVGDYAFSELRNNNIGDIELAETVKTIGENAFSGCGELSEVNFPAALESIGYAAFSDCPMLKSPVFLYSGKLKNIDGYAFFNCDFPSVELPPSLATIGKKSFGYKMIDEAEKRDDLFVILGTPGTEAEQYAKISGFRFWKSPLDLTIDLNGATLSDEAKNTDLDVTQDSFDSLKTTGKFTTLCKYGAKYELNYEAYKKACVPPEGMEPDGFEVNSVSYHYVDEVPEIKEDTTIKLLWKETVKTVKYEINLNGFEIFPPYDVWFETTGEYELGAKDDMAEIIYGGAFPNGKLYDGIKVNGVHTYDTEVEFDEDKTIEFVWKDAETSGTTGDLTWEYDEASKTLTFSGNGVMGGYSDVTQIPWMAYMKECEKIVIGEGVTWIESHAFMNFRNVKSVSLPSSLVKIKKEAFAACTSLESIVLGNRLITVEEYAFIGAPIKSAYIMNPYLVLNDSKLGFDLDETKFDSMTIYSDSGDSVEMYANDNGFTFMGRDAYKGSVDMETYSYVFDNNTGCLTISGTEMPEISMMDDIPWYGFKDEIKKVVIEDGLTNIGDDSFYECAILEEVIIPESVKIIGAHAFGHTPKLVNVEIQGNGLESIKTQAFSATGLTNIKLPGSVTELLSSDIGFYINSEGFSEPSEGFKIIAPAGSAAEEYANMFDFVFEASGETVTTAPEATTEAVETTAPETTAAPEATTEAVETTVPATTTEAAETTAPAVTTEPADTTAATDTTKPADTTKAQETTTTAKDNKTVKPAVKPNPVKVKVKTKKVKLSKLRKKAQKVKAITVKNAKGKVTFKLVKKGTSKRLFKKLNINKTTGAITLKKGTYKKGTYKIKVQITVKGDKNYEGVKLFKTVKVKIK